MSSKQILAVLLYISLLLICVFLLVFSSIYPSARSGELVSLASEVFKIAASALIGAASALMGGKNDGQKTK